MWGLSGSLPTQSGRLKVLLTVLAAALLAWGSNEIMRRERRGAERILNAVVVIETGGRLSGSGALLEGGHYVLTVNHVIEGMMVKHQPIMVRYRDGQVVMARLVKRNRHFDIALLEVPFSWRRGLSIVSDTKLGLGERVRTFGHPFGIEWMLSDGIVSRKSYFPPNENGSVYFIWTTAWIEGGNSGGPLVNDNGEIVGLVDAFMNPRGLFFGASHLNLCVSGSEILRFLSSP